MSNTCNHFVKSFFTQNPSPKEINEYRLYYCEDCRQWYSLRRLK